MNRLLIEGLHIVRAGRVWVALFVWIRFEAEQEKGLFVRVCADEEPF